jgi:molybdate transport system substrate-binding protein
MLRMLKPSSVLAAVPFLAATAMVACGGSSGGGELKISAATSLKQSVSQISTDYKGGTTQLEFAGSDAIATAIRAGRKPDAFLSASLKIPTKLAAENLVDKPVVFARNRIVVAVASSNTTISSIEDLAKPSVTIAIGSPSVPIGSYADKIIAALPPTTQAKLKGNVKTREPDASSVSAKITSGSVEAAILYATDVKASNGALKAVEIPVELGSMTKCAAAVVKGTGNEAAAAKYIANLLTPQSQKILVANGFLPAEER